MHNYIFHYNEYRNVWTAVPRELIADYFNGKAENLTESADIVDLIQEIELIYLSQQPDPEAETLYAL
jgi:hypothetical protein